MENANYAAVPQESAGVQLRATLEPYVISMPVPELLGERIDRLVEAFERKFGGPTDAARALVVRTILQRGIESLEREEALR